MRAPSMLSCALLAAFGAACGLPAYEWVPPGSHGDAGYSPMDGAGRSHIPYSGPIALVRGRLTFAGSGGGGGGGGSDPTSGVLHVYLDQRADAGPCEAPIFGVHDYQTAEPTSYPFTDFTIPDVPEGSYCISLWLDVEPLAAADAGPMCMDFVSYPTPIDVHAPATDATGLVLYSLGRCP